MPEVKTASDLYAISQGKQNSGPDRCHWCASECMREYVHDEPPPMIGQKRFSSAKNPAGAYICRGCWLWRRQRQSVVFLDGSMRDSQKIWNHSWWVTEKEAIGINSDNYSLLHKLLLDPPKRFVLCLLDGINVLNHIHLAQVNNLPEVQTDTFLHFTINNIPHDYTVYELTESLTHGPDGMEPGVRALFQLLKLEVKAEERQEVGRPTNEGKMLPGRPVKEKKHHATS